jgi:HlyD family secretion protein
MRNRRLKMKKILIILVVVLIASGIGYYFYSKENKSAEAGALTLFGNVDIRDVTLGFRVSGRLDKLFFEEGDHVKEGEVMAVLDRQPYEEQLALYSAQLDQAEANFRKYRTGSRPQEIDEARAQVKEREATLFNLEKTYKRQSELYKLNAVSQQSYDQALAARDEAKARLRMSKKALELLLAGYRNEDIMAAEAELKAAQARAAQAVTQLLDTELKAPSNGTVLTRVREAGSIVSSGAAVFSVSLDSPVWVRTYVPEPLLGKVHPGQKVEVYTDTFPDKPFTGQVGYISPQAEFTPKSVETQALRTDLVYRLRITVDNPDNTLRQGMPVTIKISGS